MTGAEPRPTEVITDLLDLAGTRPIDPRRRDPLKGLLLAANFALTCMAGTWALWTHRDWIRIGDTIVMIIGIAEFARLLASRH